MDRATIDRFRKLRKRAEYLSNKHEEDLRPFLHKIDKCTYRRLPEKPSIKDDINVTTTCSCLMSLVASNKLEDLYNEDDPETIKKILKSIIEADWESSGLDESNAFTVSIVFRAIGFLIQNKLIDPEIISTLKHDFPEKGKVPLIDIIKSFAKSPSETMKVSIFPANATLVYWFVDGIDKASIKLSKTYWDRIFTWASQEFTDQLSRASSEHDALMDPISMAMAASLNARLHRIARRPSSTVAPSLMTKLPSQIEIFHSIKILFKFQRPSGIWPKYFPIFNYKSEDAGSNYCFAFEMLEAVLNELGVGLFDKQDESIIKGFENAVQWCYDNRLKFNHKKGGGGNQKYTGWSSGGLLLDLKAGRPESWSTAVVHMFLYKLQDVLTDRIEDLTLNHYEAIEQEKPDTKEWNRLLDIDLILEQTGEELTVKEILDREMLLNVAGKSRKHFRTNPIQDSRSGLLFGPPGTSKTALVKAIAEKLGWPYVSINPSHFLKRGLENIYSEADKVFQDLSDLSGAVILFDEMDALVLTRDEDDGNNVDIMSRFLTTSMLPKLAQLHDEGQVLFFMATNYEEKFDQAIKRPGRFDLLFCMWPPSWKNKLGRLDAFYKAENVEDVEESKELIKTYLQDQAAEEKLLDKFTYGEMKAFINNLKRKKTLKQALTDTNKSDFLSKIERWANFITLNVDSNEDATKRYEEQRKLSRLQL